MIPGSPVPPGMTAANWRAHPHSPWAFAHVEDFLPVARVAAGPRVEPLPPGPPLRLDLSGVLAETHADAWLVVHRGHVLFEWYGRSISAVTRHLCFSVTKSLVGLVAERLIAAGAIDPQATAAALAAELAGTAFADATLRALLDMVDGSPFNEDYADAAAQIHDYSRHFWGDGAGGVVAGLKALTPGTAVPGFAYRTPVTDVAALMMERATGEPIEALLERLVWQPAGCADDALWVRDTGGRAIASAGLSCTLRDLARIGLWMIAAKHSAPIQALARGGDPVAFARGNQPTRTGWSYRSFWWLDHPNAAWNALGVFGQRLHVRPSAELVIARFGSHPLASNAVTDAVHASAFAAIRSALTEA